jgi:hypothetical protein
MLEQPMKKTWKQLLGTLTGGAALGAIALGTLMGPVFGQNEDDGVVVLGQGAPQSALVPAEQSGEGSVRLGVHPAAGVDGLPPDAEMPVEAAPHRSVFAQQAPTIHPAGVPGHRGYASGDAIGYAVTENPQDVLFRVGRRNMDVYGIDEGFTSVAAYLSRSESANSVWFVEPRLLLTDQGRGGLNLGFGQKAYYPELDRVFSLSGWWDFDAGHNSDYHQVGASFEMIGQNMSLRSNAYFVVSRDEHQFGVSNIGSPIPTDDGRLVQQQIVFTEVAYNQADVEVSMPMPLAGDYGWAWGGGAYFLFGGDGRDATGVKGRIESQVTEDLWVNALISSDRVFDTNVSVNLEFTVPHAPPSRWFRQPKVRDHLWASVRRYHRVATTIVEDMRTTPVMGMGGNGQMQQLRLGLIDPNVTDDPLLAFGGSGTSSDPWKSIADYMDEALTTQEQFGIIAVRARRDATDLNLDTTIVLLDNQSLLGEGVIHSLDGINTIDIPTINPDGMRPLLSNASAPGANVITLANNNQVAGFLIDGTGTGSGIVGDGIRGFNINQVEMNNVVEGIRIRSLSDASGRRGIIRDNVINGIGLGSARGISIEHESGVLALLVSNNTVSNFRGEDANQNGMLDPSEDINNNGILDPGEDLNFNGILDLSEDLNGNGILDAGFGLYVSASNGSQIFANDPLNPMLPFGILDNTFIGNGSGMSLTARSGAVITADVRRNIATGSTDLGEDANGNQVLDPGEDINGNGVLDFGSGFNVFADNAAINLVTFTDNSATGGFGNGGTFQTFNGGTINVVNPNIDPNTFEPGLAFARNTFDDNDLDGLFVRADSGSIIFDQIQESSFDSNGDDGLDLETDNGGTIFIRDPLLQNSFVNNGDNGIEVTSGIGGGIAITLGGGGAGTANIITGNGQNAVPDTGAGIFLGTAGGMLNATFSGLVSTGNSGSGAVLFLDGGEIFINGGITNNTFVNNGRHGLEIINNNGGRLITPFVSDNDFSNNAMAGMFLGGTGPAPSAGPPTTTALIDLGSVTRNNFNRDIRGDEGILIDARDVRIMGTLTRNTFIGRRPTVDDDDIVTEGGAGRGIGGTIGGSSTIPTPGGLSLVIGTALDSDRNTFQDNGGAHIGLVMGGNTTNTIVVRNGTFSDAFYRRTVGQPLDQAPTGLFQGEGIHYVVRDTATLTGGVVDSFLSGNEGDGLKIEVIGNNDAGNSSLFPAAQVNNFMIVGNEFNNNGTPTLLADGIEVIRRERGQFNDLLIMDNLIQGNSDNGIAIASIGVNQLNLQNMRADTVMIVNNEITGNSQDGIEFLIGADADMAARLDSNLITENGLNGIEVRELIQDAKDSRSITGLWTNNTITDNGDDGIDLSGYMGNTLTELTEAGVYTLAPPAPGTTFPVLGRVRTFGLVIGDVTLNPVGVIDADFNEILRNAGDGVDITGGGAVTVANNRINDNGTPEFVDGDAFTGFIARHAGINIAPPELNAGQSTFLNGQDPRPLPNDEVNPDLDAYRDVFLFSNEITSNQGDGIQFLAQSSIEAADSASSLGVGGAAIETRLTIARNKITENEFRGIDILQRPGDSDNEDRNSQDPDGVPGVLISSFVSTDVSIIGNHVKGNQWEGIYIVQTVDDVQNQISPSWIAIDGNGDTIANNESLRAQGGIADIARLRLDIHANEVIGNGLGIVDFPSTGLVIRVGTSGGTPVVAGYPAPVFDPNFGTGNAANYFATSGFNQEDLNGDGELDNDLDGDGYLDAAAVTGSGVSASITENLFSGNFGDDMLFHTFTATANPAVTNGTWNNDEFTVMSFQADPLARLDLIFSFNQFDSVQPNNNERGVGTSPGNLGAEDAGAYYGGDPNFNEDEFKSRIANQGGDPPGPFSSGTRQRNATRFASRYLTGSVLPPLISPDQGIFKYPGMGNSTLRVRGTGNFYRDQSLGSVTLEQIFIFDEPELAGDPDLVDFLGEANGVFHQPGAGFGALPWGWDDLETGTPPLPPTFIGP